MNSWLKDSLFFGVLISLIGYETGVFLRRKTGLAVLNPLLVSVVIVIVLLSAAKVDYEVYLQGAKYLSYLLTPATVSLAIPLSGHRSLLRKNSAAILIGITSGVLTSLCTVLIFALLFRLGYVEYVTLLPKSITTAIGMPVSEELGGIAAITAAVIIVTGILGSMIAERVFRIFHIEEAVARGVALGTSSHVIGTVKAMELGEEEGAVSGLAIAVSGLITVVCISVFAKLY